MRTTASTPEYDFMDVDEVADLLRISAGSLYTQRHRGQNPGALAVRVGRRLRWRRADIESWWEKARVAQ